MVFAPAYPPAPPEDPKTSFPLGKAGSGEGSTMTARLSTAARTLFVSLVLSEAVVLLPLLVMSCGGESGVAANDPPPAAEPARPSKIEFPVRSELVLANQPAPGGVADIDLVLENTLPVGCTVEVDLRLPGRVALEKGNERARHALGARGRANVPFRVKIPDAGRYVIEALIHLPNPEGIPATGGSTLVIDLGAPEKAGPEPVSVRTKDGKDLSITVTE